MISRFPFGLDFLLLTILLILSIGKRNMISSNQQTFERDYCGNDTVNLSPECWDKLNVTGYLLDWWEKNRDDCDIDPYRGEGFASCFQQKQKTLSYACNNISLADCYPPPPSNEITVEAHYILYSIFGIWWWFNSLWIAALDGTLLADLPLASIIKEINPVLPGSTSLGVVLSALLAGLAFLTFPTGGTTGKVLSTALGQAPGLAKTFTTTGTLDSEIVQIGEIQASLGSVLTQLQVNLANTLHMTQLDFGSFLAFASDGSFIANQPSLNATTTGITSLLKTFIVSQALQANNIIITVARNISVYNLSHQTFNGHALNGTMLPQNAWHVNCKVEEDAETYGICDNWWIDSQTNDSYSFFKLNNMNENYYRLMNVLFGNGWTTGEELFLGSNDCKTGWDQEISNVASPTFSIAYNTTATLKCFSNVRVCDWNQTNDISQKDGLEFEGGGGCAFAWPNFCIDGRGYSDSNSTGGYLDTNLTEYSIIVEGSEVNYENYIGFAAAYNGQEGYFEQFGSLVPGPEFLPGVAETLAFNSLYDVVNNRIDALIQQAQSMDSKQCHSLSPNGTRPGWGGAGYHVNDQNCDIYPASYLGPGLYFDTELCGPLHRKRSLASDVQETMLQGGTRSVFLVVVTFIVPLVCCTLTAMKGWRMSRRSV